MAVELQIEWEGRSAADFARQFKVAANVTNFKPALLAIGKTVISPSVRKNFEAGGRPQWLPLAPSTIERKARAGAPDPSKVLVHSGRMASAAADSSAYQVTKDKLVAAPFATRYWVYHQRGQGVPQRIMMSLQAADRTKINTIFAQYLRQFMDFSPTGRPFTGGGLGGS
jgi:phage gpG-like protein